MRCGCPECDAFMIHAEDADDCVCPDCGHRCHACLGTNTVWSREKLAELKTNPFAERSFMERFEEPEQDF